MTGFGRATSQYKHTSISIEIRTVNNRFQEIFVRLPKLYQSYEYEIRKRISKQIERGKIDVFIQFTEREQSNQSFKLNTKLVKRYSNLINELKKIAGIEDEINLNHLLALDGIFVQDEISNENDDLKKFILEILDKAIVNLNEIRKSEGDALITDLSERNQQILAIIDKVEKKNRDIAQTEFKKLQIRVAKLVDDNELEQNRLLTELVLIANRSDVTEECVRLKSHINLCHKELTNEASGKRLNFLLQEMNREANTIGAKTPNVKVSHLLVSAKQEIEKMREQVQNLE